MAKGFGEIMALGAAAMGESGFGKYMAALCERAGIAFVCPVTGDKWRNNGVVLVEDGNGPGQEAFRALGSAMRGEGNDLVMAFYTGSPDEPDEYACIEWLNRKLIFSTSMRHHYGALAIADEEIKKLPERLEVWVSPEFESLDWDALARAREERAAWLQAEAKREERERLEAIAANKTRKEAELAERQAQYYTGNTFSGRKDGTRIPEDWTIVSVRSFGDKGNPLVSAFAPRITITDLAEIVGWLGGGEVKDGREVTIVAKSPGLVIGKGGSMVKSLSVALGRRIKVVS